MPVQPFQHSQVYVDKQWIILIVMQQILSIHNKTYMYMYYILLHTVENCDNQTNSSSKEK